MFHLNQARVSHPTQVSKSKMAKFKSKLPRDDGSTPFVSKSAMTPTGQRGMGQSQQQTSLDTSPLLEGFLFHREESHMVDIYRDIYYNDAISGTCVDMMSTLPFGGSGFSLDGFQNDGQRDVFLESLERLNLRTLLPELSVDYLVTGTFVGSLLFDQERKIFMDVIPQDFKNLEIQSFPFYGFDPIITVNYPKEVIALLSSGHPRLKILEETYGPVILNKIKSGKVELDPISTIYLPRKTSSVTQGISYYRRILPLYFLEKNIYRGTLMESIKRQRAILHITMGDQDWEPTEDDLDYVTELFTNADADPLGAVIATRNGVQPAEVRCLVGGSLIHTSKGLIAIKDLVEHNHSELLPGTRVDLPIEVRGFDQTGYSRVKYWWYQGKQSVFSMILSDGTEIKPTANHKWPVVLKNSVEFVTTENVVGRYVLKGKDLKVWEGITLDSFDAVEVKSVTYIGEEHVYDLTMDESVSPLFMVNGVLSHNSGGEFWTIGALWNDTSPMKYRALGINEGFLSPEASFNVVDAAITTFMSSLQDYRDKLTRRVFYHKVFPIISLVHEYYKDDLSKQKIADIKEDIDDNDVVALMSKIQDTSSLVIPTITWEKQLKPSGDDIMLQHLSTLKDLDVPIPLRVLAAAGGLNIDSLLSSREEDIKIRKEISAWKAAIAALAPPEPGMEASGYTSTSEALSQSDWISKYNSLLTQFSKFTPEMQQDLLSGNPYSSSVQNSGGKVSLAERDFGEASEAFELDANGKRHYTINQKAAQNKMDDKIIKALRSGDK